MPCPGDDAVSAVQVYGRFMYTPTQLHTVSFSFLTKSTPDERHSPLLGWLMPNAFFLASHGLFLELHIALG